MLLSYKNGGRGNLIVILFLLFLMLVPIADSFVTYTATVVITPIQWLIGWDKRVKVIIDPTDVDAPLSDFPVLIHLSSNSGVDGNDVTFVFDELQNDGNRLKIAVTTENNSQCYVEIERWDTASEEAWLWVKVPVVNDTSETTLYLYYDSDHVDNNGYVGDSNSLVAENVWDSSFKLATHMNDNPSIFSIRDSTSNNNDGTKLSSNNPLQADGKIAQAQDFSLDYINCGSSSTLNILNTLTIEAWINPDTIAGPTYQNSIVDRGSSWWFLVHNSGRLAFLCFPPV